jgi:hypothetical protein
MITLPGTFVPGAAGVAVEDERPPEWWCRRMRQAPDGAVLSTSERGG